MKIGYYAPDSIHNVNGGLRQQFYQTLRQIKNSDHEVEPIRSAESLENGKYDLIHVFRAGFDTLGLVREIHRLNIPLVVSPVMYSNRNYLNLKAGLLIDRILSGLKLKSPTEMLIKQEICSLADYVLPNTKTEGQLVHALFRIPASRIMTVPNGVESRFQNAEPKTFINKYGFKDFILFVGQASSPRKNVLNLIKAVSGLDRNLVIIGDLLEDDYSGQCKKEARSLSNVHLIPSVGHNSELLASAYAAAKVFVLPSWFETPGIAALEAALADCCIVITNRGGTQEYFKDDAIYIDPLSTGSIRDGIEKGLQSASSDILKKRILQEYSWEKAGELTLECYNKVYRAGN